MSWLPRRRRRQRRRRDYTAPSQPSVCSASSGFRLPYFLCLYWMATRGGSPLPLRLMSGFSPSPSSLPPSLSLAPLSSLCSVSLGLCSPPPCCCSESCRGSCRYWRKDLRGRNIHRVLSRCCIFGEDIPRPPPPPEFASQCPLLLLLLPAHLAHPATAACPAWRGAAFRGQAQLFPASRPLPRC